MPTVEPAITKMLVFVATDGATPNGAIYAFDGDGCTTPPCRPLWSRTDLGTKPQARRNPLIPW
jgi:hypothetical protein